MYIKLRTTYILCMVLAVQSIVWSLRGWDKTYWVVQRLRGANAMVVSATIPENCYISNLHVRRDGGSAGDVG